LVPKADDARLKAAHGDAQAAAKYLIATLVALPEPSMRSSWLAERIQGRADAHTASSLDHMTSFAQLPNDQAREALLTLAVLLARQRDSGWLWALYQTAKQNGHTHLERLLRPTTGGSLPPPSVELAMPDYGVGRPLSVGERKTMARRPTRAQLEKLLADPHPLVIKQLLEARAMKEEDVIVMATRRPAHGPTLDALLDAPRWILRKRVRLSLVLNPGTPHGMALPFVATLAREDLRLIIEATPINATLRTVARELHLRLPPQKGDIELDGIH
jgi:hypothetical protein